MKISTTKTELDLTNERLSELTEMRDGINTILQTLQDGFVNGKTSLDEVQAEQARLNTLNSSIKALEAKQNELQAAFNEMTKAEVRQNLIEKARTTALEAETLFDESLELRRELDAAIGGLAEKFTDKLFEFHEKRKAYVKLRGQFEPNQTPGLSNDVVLLLEKNHLNFPPVRFGLSVQAACQVIEVEREKSELAERQAEKARQMSSGIN
jgi:predicted transcriptional regulator